MKIYKLHFADIEHGTIIQWKRNKREIAKFKREWRESFPLRELVLTETTAIPDDKQGLVDWLNQNATR